MLVAWHSVRYQLQVLRLPQRHRWPEALREEAHINGL